MFGMSTTEVSAITTALTAAAVGIIATFSKQFRGLLVAMCTYGIAFFKRKTVQEKTQKQKFAEMIFLEKAAIDLWKSEFKAKDYCHRWLYLQGKNHGGMPVAGRPYKVLALDGNTKFPQKDDPKEKYNFSFRIDDFYERMLLDLVTKEYAILVTKDMDKHAQLRSWYEKEGVVSSLLFYIKERNESELLYFSVANYEREFTQVEIDDIVLSLKRVKYYLEQTP